MATYRIGKYSFATAQDLLIALVDFPVERIDTLDDGYLLIFTRSLNEDENITLYEILQPPSQDILDFREFIDTYKDEYQAMLDRYDEILRANPDTVMLPQLARAVQDLALYQRRITKIIERLIW